jgi:hypothetical protein
MKNVFLKSKMFAIAAACLLSAYSITGCEDDDADSTATGVEYKNVAITGVQEVPPVATTRAGTFSGTFNKTTKVLTYTITHNVTDAVAAHFHEAPKDSSGAVVIPIAAPLDAITNRTATLTPAQESDLLRGRLYINIHSPAFPLGEIRGQIPAE